MAKIEQKTRVEFDGKEVTALKTWADGQVFAEARDVEDGYPRSISSGVELNFCARTSERTSCGQQFKVATNKIVATCAELHCDGAAMMRENVERVLARTDAITGAYEAFVEA